MKKFLILCFFMSFLLAGLALGQAADQDFGIKFSGYVKTDFMFDSRQTVSAREGHFLLYPAPESKDQNGDDKNAVPNLNILAVQTRLKGTITGPDAFGAKTGGVIEAAFFGHSNSDVNGFRLRHAFLKLKWTNKTLLMGQFWHPMFVTDCFPGTVSFNTGMPFQPFSRNPQIRLTQSAGNLNIMIAAIAQRDFASTGPDGTSSKYLRNAAIPNMHLQLQVKNDKSIIGAGVDWKTLKPRLETPLGYKSTTRVNSLSFIGYARINLPKITWKIEGVYGQNLTDHLMLGGYAVETVDAKTKEETYMPTKLYSLWTDISGGKKVGLGCFAGIQKNLGTDKQLLDIWGRGTDIDMLYRISPRIMWNSGKTRFAVECEYTGASYGSMDEKGKVQDAEFVNNLRMLFGAYYFF